MDAIQAILDGKTYEQPGKSVLNDFKKQLDTMSNAQLLPFYKNLKIKYPKDYGFENASTLNEIGYYLLQKNSINEAITIFNYNTVLFSEDGNVYDSLAEAYYKQGDKKNALINYKKSIKLDPNNQTAKGVIKELEKR